MNINAPPIHPLNNGGGDYITTTYFINLWSPIPKVEVVCHYQGGKHVTVTEYWI